LEAFLGSAAGLSPATITRLTAQWQDEAKVFNDRDLSCVDYVYLWVDGIHVNVRLEGTAPSLVDSLPVRIRPRWKDVRHAESVSC